MSILERCRLLDVDHCAVFADALAEPAEDSR
jgi:hypothetical protein